MSSVCGYTSLKTPIEVEKLTTGKSRILLMGGVHGDEPEGYFLVEKFIKEKLWLELEDLATLWVVPRLNPDGCSKNQRKNSNNVDLNRNMPTKDWTSNVAKEKYHPGPKAGSELETQAIIQLINDFNPQLIISAHSWEPQVNYNGPCKKLAEHMASFNGYKITDDIGYPTPGSLGTWAGWERKIPTITLEIERGSSELTIWKTHAEALVEAMKYLASEKDLE